MAGEDGRERSRIAPDALAALIRECCEGVGLSADDSGAVAQVLVYADLRGQEAHGFVRVANYMDRVAAGLAGGTGAIRVAAQAGALRRLDAGRAIGPAAAIRAIDLAAELAAEHGVGVVGAGGAVHFGPAGFYARRAASRGLIGLVVSNGPAAMAPHGASRPLVGTNPLAIGIPVGRHGEFVLDISTSSIPRGRVRAAVDTGAELPAGSAVDAEGRPTTDPAAALAGSLLPFAGAKGSGLALAVSLLAAALAGAELDDEMAAGSMASASSAFPLFGGTVGQVFAVIDPEPLLAPAALARLEAFVDRLRALPAAEGFEEVLLPGQHGDRLATERASAGIPLAAAAVDAVAASCREHGLDELAARWERAGG